MTDALKSPKKENDLFKNIIIKFINITVKCLRFFVWKIRCAINFIDVKVIRPGKKISRTLIEPLLGIDVDEYRYLVRVRAQNDFRNREKLHGRISLVWKMTTLLKRAGNTLLTERKTRKFKSCGPHRIQYFPGTSTGTKTAWVFSFTGVSNEPRVIRQSRMFLEQGWRVVVFGYSHKNPRNPAWHFALLPRNPAYNHHSVILLKAQYVLTSRLLAQPLGKVFQKWLGLHHHRSHISYRHIQKEVVTFSIRYPHLKPDLVVSHDFHTCDVGYTAATLHGSKFAVDCHEYARGQYMHDPNWVRFTRPYIIGMHQRFLPQADVVTTVCDGIGALLKQEEHLKKPVVTVRSVPFYVEQSFRPCGPRPMLLYHGDVSYIRGLHKAIKSMPLWGEHFDLTIRGGGDAEYLKSLREIADSIGMGNRVFFEEPVPFDQIIPAANRADIGYFVHKDVSPQKRFVLPNKFFEYIMGGLALCVNDLPEMARISNQYDLGVLVADYDEAQIAEAVNSLTIDRINQCKKNALLAAKDLNWDTEQKYMAKAYNDLFVGDR